MFATLMRTWQRPANITFQCCSRLKSIYSLVWFTPLYSLQLNPASLSGIGLLQHRNVSRREGRVLIIGRWLQRVRPTGWEFANVFMQQWVDDFPSRSNKTNIICGTYCSARVEKYCLHAMTTLSGELKTKTRDEDRNLNKKFDGRGKWNECDLPFLLQKYLKKKKN